MTAPPRLLTTAEVCAELGLSRWVVGRMRDRGQIPFMRLPTGTIRYERRRLDAWLREAERGGKAAR